MDKYDYYTEADFAREAAEEKAAEQSWHLHIFNMMATHRISMSKAIRWDLDAMDAKNGGWFDTSFYCYLHGISYALSRVIASILKEEPDLCGDIYLLDIN